MAAGPKAKRFPRGNTASALRIFASIIPEKARKTAQRLKIRQGMTHLRAKSPPHIRHATHGGQPPTSIAGFGPKPNSPKPTILKNAPLLAIGDGAMGFWAAG